jgi:A/G-specific adenine glycosylase
VLNQISEFSEDKIKIFKNAMKHWEKTYSLRKFPWRKTNNSYKIIVSEILLRRTKAEAVNSIWTKFFDRFSTLDSLCKASENNLKELLRPLGLVENRIKTLKSLCENGLKYKPTEEDLLKINGVGSYIARMFIVMKYNERKLVYDANFRRVYNRYFGLNFKKNLREEMEVETLSEKIIPDHDFRTFLLTVLDFAALTCKPISPDCYNCNLNDSCHYFSILKK